MVTTIDSPFRYPTEEEARKAKRNAYYREWRRKKRLKEKKGQWGGKRKGAGRKKKVIEIFKFNLNKIQEKNLRELGEGSVKAGIQKLIDQHV